ncbi:MAG: hypothetical protein F6K63_25580 [Moorea sp. SIO1G6]|uniref:Uncharacterized protein n=1 Tax=Moorena producens (strain JHB) TaxID=1454205 RepID=A0A9Q9STC5_MOOP1|nr:MULTISPECIES: hypothetical protein [Moorena]NEQ10475.1 hypothetical protein [Moorena sp. SIO4E2]NET67572.1 hypothetical protein [Moorena sp. SIO1G6]WAN69292.1 hypothetical protein BJP36_43830 [Moorena producens JHB]
MSSRLAELVVKLQFPTPYSLGALDSRLRSALCYVSYPVEFNLSQI